jgi:hypothetical protein
MLVGVVIVLFILLAIGGWAFLAGIGALFGLGYWRTNNQGYLIAATTFIGLGIGVGLELALAREGGVVMMFGIGLGLLTMAALVWRETKKLQWWSLALGILCFVLTVLLWSSSVEELQVFLVIFPFAILALLIYAAFEFWRSRRALKMA